MTETIHDTAVKVDVYPDEFLPIMKALKYALMSPDYVKYVLDGSEKEVATLESFLDDFCSLALNEAV